MKKSLIAIITSFTLAAIVTFAIPVTTYAAFHGSMSDGALSAKGDDQPADLVGEQGIFAKVTNVMLFVIGAISVIMIIIGGIRYVISGGKQDAVTGAKDTILYAIIGIVVALLAYAVVQFVLSSFSASGGGGGIDV